jgi:predicted nucleic acid-binding protein
VTGTIVLDSFALLAFFRGEPGAQQVAGLLETAQRGEPRLAMSVVNLAEVIYRTERERGLQRAQEALAKVLEYPVELFDVDLELALAAAHFKASQSIALADCLAAALAQRLDAAVLTGDPDFQRLEGAVPIEWLAAG